ncbi:hypothetical protein SRABI70_04518 [Pseudomonas sp. Bi70]|nr:hypothetical protein SRABI70_04518 [Pseudomonas sp. Bi70]
MLQGLVAAIRVDGPEQGDVVIHGLAVHEGLGDHPALGEFGLDPVGVDVAAKAGGELVFLAALEKQVAVGVERADIAGGQPVAGERRLAQITQQRRAAHPHFTVFGDAHLDVGQRAADAARPVVRRRVEAHHRGAFGQPVALVDRQVQLCGALEQLVADPRTSDRHEMKLAGIQLPMFEGDDQTE